MVNWHRCVLIPPETKLFSSYHDAPQWIRRKTIARINRDLIIDLDQRFVCRSMTTCETLEEVFRQFAARTGRNQVTCFGEKTPEHTSRIDAIREVYPTAPIIALVRNGYAVAESLTRVPWLNCDLRGGAKVWRYYMEHINRAVDSGIGHFHTVRYEDLVSQPTQTLEQVFRWIGVDPCEAQQCLNPNPERDRWLFPERERVWKGDAMKEIDADKQSSSSLLSKDQRGQVEAACGAMLRRWGYAEEDSIANEVSSGLPRRGTGRMVDIACDFRSTIKILSRIPANVLLSEGMYHAGQSWRHWWRRSLDRQE